MKATRSPRKATVLVMRRELELRLVEILRALDEVEKIVTNTQGELDGKDPHMGLLVRPVKSRKAKR